MSNDRTSAFGVELPSDDWAEAAANPFTTLETVEIAGEKTMPTQQRTEHDPPEVAGDLDDDREVLRPQAATPIHLPEHTDACQVVAHGDNDSLVATRALHDDKRLCRDCARAERRGQR